MRDELHLRGLPAQQRGRGGREEEEGLGESEGGDASGAPQGASEQVLDPQAGRAMTSSIFLYITRNAVISVLGSTAGAIEEHGEAPQEGWKQIMQSMDLEL